ncbi:MAG: PIG-L family deacetylase [Propionibacteriaceae bacterium]|nr:PIG-L family deacetylase [Propionibacteriaceae bacterium]
MDDGSQLRPEDTAAGSPKRKIVVFHAHPDDETLSTGALLAFWTGLGHEVTVITATRGERGEAYPGICDDRTLLPQLRAGELSQALAVLGVGTHCFLGTPPARVPGLPPVNYLDSGMRWVTATLAGSVADAGELALSNQHPSVPAADLAAYCRIWGAEILISYDAIGGYGHPDHVACHQIGVETAAMVPALAFFTICSAGIVADAKTHHFELRSELATVREALQCYSSQLRLDADEIVHVGGQRQPIATTIRLRATD